MPASLNYGELDKQLLGEVYTSNETWKNLLYLCEECGSRFNGTEDEIKARNFVRRKMKSYGLEVRCNPFPYLGWSRHPKGAELRIVAPKEVRVPCISLPYSPATRRGGLLAELTNVGDGLPDDFERLGRMIAGKVAMVTNRTPAYFRQRSVHRAEKYGRAVAAGAVGFIYVNMSDGRLPETGCLRFNKEAEIPGLSICKEDYSALCRLSAKGTVQARVVTRDSFQPAKSCNVVGELKPSRPKKGIVIVGAHYDGHDITQGAGDNANGVAVLLEVARVLALHREHLHRTIRFVSYSCEEIGLIGAYADVKKLGEAVNDVRLMLNIDGVPAGCAKGLLFHEWPRMKEYVQKLSRDLSYGIPFGSRLSAYSDFFPYFLAGVPTAGLSNPLEPARGRGFGHTSADTVDKIDPRDLREAANVVSRVVLRTANDDRWPLKRRSESEVLRILEEAGFREVLEAEGKSLD